jgi:hypothetical protein
VNESLIPASVIASNDNVSRLSANHDSSMLNRELVVNESLIDGSAVTSNDDVSCFSESSSANSRGRYLELETQILENPSHVLTNTEIMESLRTTYCCRRHGTLETLKQYTDGWFIMCTCPAHLRLHYNFETSQPSPVLSIMMTATERKLWDASTFFHKHFKRRTTVPLVSNHDANVTLLKEAIHVFIQSQAVIPSAEAVLASLLLRPEALGGPCNKTIYAVGSEEVRALIVIEISSFLSNLAAQDCESETSTDFFSNNVQGLNDFRLQNSIEPVIERFLNSPNSCGAPLPLDSSLSVFLGHFGFRDGAQQMYTLPIDPSLVALVRTNFPHLTENECSTHINTCIVMLSPCHLHAIWHLIKSPTHRHLMIFYLDGKHKIIRAGKKGTVLLTLATVVPRLCPGASQISRSVMPCVSGSENSVATFMMNHTYKSVIKSLFKLECLSKDYPLLFKQEDLTQARNYIGLSILKGDLH